MMIAVQAVLGIVFAFFVALSQTEGNFTFTYNMALRCKEHLCKNGYSYDTFYKIDLEARRTADVAFEMHLAILAASNGHILLSPVPNPQASDAVYEIVVGGGGNKFTELRRNLRRNAKTSAKTLGILSSVEFRAFFIRMSEDGVIEFGKEGDSLALLTYTDISPLTIKYFSFAAWNGVEAKFLYDCPTPGDETTSPDSQEVEHKLSNSERLKRTLLLDRTPLPPGPVVAVRLGVKVTSVRYDPFESKLTTGMAIVTSWTDDSMAWNPSKFNGTTRLTFHQGQIWRPTFFAYNSDDVSVLDTRSPTLISMVNSGEATFHFQTELSTWCYEHVGDYNRWPHDQYSCSILIGAYELHETISIKEIDSNDDKMKVFADIDTVVLNEWEMTLKKGIVEAEIWDLIFMSEDNHTHQSDRLILNLGLYRRATTLNIIFYSPLLALITFILVSFWNEPLKISRISFYAAATVTICVLLCFVDFLVPVHTMPSILVLYTTVLGGVLLAFLINVVMMTSLIDIICTTSAAQTMLTSKWFRIVCCLPEMKSCRNYESVNEGFANQDDDDSGFNTATRNRTISEMQIDRVPYTEKEEIAQCVDRTLFVLLTVVFGILLSMHY